MSFAELKNAVEILGIPPLSTFAEVKKIYKKEVRKNHPDINKTPKKSLDEINRAYEVVYKYIDSYRFFFTKEEFDKQYPEESYGRQFRA